MDTPAGADPWWMTHASRQNWIVILEMKANFHKVLYDQTALNIANITEVVTADNLPDFWTEDLLAEEEVFATEEAMPAGIDNGPVNVHLILGLRDSMDSLARLLKTIQVSSDLNNSLESTW